MKYRCIRTCFWQDRLWTPGEIYEAPGKEDVPHHFERVKTAESTAKQEKKEDTGEKQPTSVEGVEK